MRAGVRGGPPAATSRIFPVLSTHEFFHRDGDRTCLPVPDLDVAQPLSAASRGPDIDKADQCTVPPWTPGRPPFPHRVKGHAGARSRQTVTCSPGHGRNAAESTRSSRNAVRVLKTVVGATQPKPRASSPRVKDLLRHRAADGRKSWRCAPPAVLSRKIQLGIDLLSESLA